MNKKRKEEKGGKKKKKKKKQFKFVAIDSSAVIPPNFSHLSDVPQAVVTMICIFSVQDNVLRPVVGGGKVQPLQVEDLLAS